VAFSAQPWRVQLDTCPVPNATPATGREAGGGRSHALGWMNDCHFLGWNRDACGYLASALVLATFSMKSMRPLRITAIASNIALLLYALTCTCSLF
jgi:hypothetical protein